MILVTGGSGYVGSHLVRRLAEAGRPVRAMIFDEERANAEGRLAELSVETVVADVTDPPSLGPAYEGIESVIHTVAIAIEGRGRRYETVNHQGTKHVLAGARRAGVRRFLHMSQLGADPELPYRFLASKGYGEMAVARSGLDWTSFNPSVIWGPEDEFANTFAKLAPFSPLIFPIVGDERSRFQSVWVEDVVTFVLAALDDPATVGKRYELGGPEVLTLAEIERRTLEAAGARRRFIRLPAPLIRIAVGLMERLLPSPPVTSSLLELLAVSNVPVENSISRYVAEPRPFKPEHISGYMRQFRPRATLAQFLGR